MKNVFIVLAVIIVLIGGVLLWDSLRNDTINKTIINDIEEDLTKAEESFDEIIEEVEDKVEVEEDVAEEDTSVAESSINDDKYYENAELALSLYYPVDWFYTDELDERIQVDFRNFETQEGYPNTGNLFMSITLFDNSYSEIYDRINSNYTDKIEGYEESEIVYNNDTNLNGKNGKKVRYKNDKPMEGKPYDSIVYYIGTDNDKYYKIKILKTQDSDSELFDQAQEIIDSISWK